MDISFGSIMRELALMGNGTKGAMFYPEKN